MCIFSRGVRHVGSTRIFAGHQDDGRQALIYSMEVELSAPTAMVLPLPTPPGAGRMLPCIWTTPLSARLSGPTSPFRRCPPAPSFWMNGRSFHRSGMRFGDKSIPAHRPDASCSPGRPHRPMPPVPTVAPAESYRSGCGRWVCTSEGW